MLRMSYCDHFSSVVRPSVNIFKRLLLWSRRANFAQISYGASLGWGNERLLNGRGPLTKMAALPIYGKKKLKKSSPEPRMPLGWIFARIIVDGRSTKVAESVHKSSETGCLPKLLKRLSYVDIWPFYSKVKFTSLCVCMSPITFVWGNCLEFQTTSPLKPLSQICSNF